MDVTVRTLSSLFTPQRGCELGSFFHHKEALQPWQRCTYSHCSRRLKQRRHFVIHHYYSNREVLRNAI